VEPVGGGGYRSKVVLEVCVGWGLWSDMARIGAGLLIESGQVLDVGDSLDLVHQSPASNTRGAYVAHMVDHEA
jgi:hypothetical protein